MHRLNLRDLPLWEKVVVRAIQFAQVTLAQFQRDKLVIRASGLAYSSLLAAVPLVAVAFAIFSAFGAFDEVKRRVQEFLFSQFLPTFQDELVVYFNQFADGARSLGVIGSLALILTSILLLDSVESNFNDIWHVTTRRKIISKITSYTSVLVFGTLLLGASLTFSARLKAALFRDVSFDPGMLEQLGGWLFPLALSFFAFLLLYLIVPFTRVQLKSAVLGAAIGSVFWELGKNLFANWIGESVRYSTIYGSLAVIPIFLIWLYITWIIVLLGLEIAFAHQHFAALIRSRSLGDADECDRVSTGLQLYTLIAERFHQGDGPPTADELSQRFLVATGSVARHVDRLVEAGLARRVAIGSGNEGVVPARSLEAVRVADVITAFLPTGDEEMRRRPIEIEVKAIGAAFREAGFDAVGETTFLQLVQGLAAPRRPV